MTFKEVYTNEKRRRVERPTPAQMFITNIAQKTKVSEVTVRLWLSGTQKPSKLAKEVISDYLKRPINELFPE